MKSEKQLRKEKYILEKAIQKAIEGGWKMPEWIDDCAEDSNYLPHSQYLYPTIIFDHGFAKALWGDSWANFIEGQSGDLFSLQAPNWKGHLMNMVISVNPINYLGKNI